jgi:ketosteroid isomerase-like protein
MKIPMFPIPLLLLMVSVWAGLPVSAQALRPQDDAAIRAVMQAQQDSWNKADLNGFMEGYWRSSDLKFVGKTGVTYGWQATLERYQKGYPDAAAMGKLSFDILHLEKISPKAALMVGKWHLQREADAPQGYFSLVWRKLKGQWVIVADHSS